MGKRIESDRDWLEKHLRTLKDLGKVAYEVDKTLPSHQPTYDKGSWTGLKLICLNYYLPVYLNILGKKCKVGYVDVFAGPGVDKIGRRKIPVPGSPILSMFHSSTSREFDIHLFGDTNPDYIDALKGRIDALRKTGHCSFRPDSISVQREDANVLLKKAPTILNDNQINHCLLFVDPEGLELKWSSLEYFARNFEYSDWIVLFPSAGLVRVMNRRDAAAWKPIHEFIGPGGEELEVGCGEEQAIALYRRNLADLGKEISTEIIVTGDGSFHYHLIPAVRRTPRNSPWFKSLLEAKRRIDNLSGEALEIVSLQIDGIQKVL